ncbi:MAG: hypothetical protein PQJ61_09590 [Spirochaetales bacterium]|uniref:Uncharacterized protein n=1 Tax=Candidatus Thalassospirochaeta sargassi TaxID=3119039 RepID=A0AAJ1IFR5_9SPIO|nr:hypothetical protein [Spirochaetales bacterium]
MAIFFRIKIKRNKTVDSFEEKNKYDPNFFTEDGKEKHIFEYIFIQDKFPDEGSILIEYNEQKNQIYKENKARYKNIPDDELQYISIFDLEKNSVNELKNEGIVNPTFIGRKYKIVKNKLLINVWEIPSLTDSFINGRKEKDLKIALGNLIHKKLNIDIGFIDDFRGPLRKYLYFHQSIQTTFQSEYGTPMFIEIFGIVVHVNGKDIIDPDIKENGFRRSLEEELPGPIIIRVLQANWSKISYPGVNVPCYM